MALDFQIGAAGNLENFKQHTQGRMVVRAFVAIDESVDAREEILQTQHRAYTFIQRKLVTDHFRLV